MTLEEKTPARKSVDSYVGEYFGYTTSHGFSRLAAARGISWHVFWIVMLVGAHCAFYYHTYLLIKDYTDKPIRTKVTMKHGKVSDVHESPLMPHYSVIQAITQ